MRGGVGGGVLELSVAAVQLEPGRELMFDLPSDLCLGLVAG